MNNLSSPMVSQYLECFMGQSGHAQRYESGSSSLLHLTIETAVEDCKSLIKEGIIVNGKCIDTWPVVNGKPKLIIHDYNTVAQVNELLDFMRNGGLDKMLKALHSKLDSVKINKHLGI